MNVEALEAAAAAVCRDRLHYHAHPFCVVSYIDCKIAFIAAMPIIEAEVRERIAAELEREYDDSGVPAYEYAARIAREQE